MTAPGRKGPSRRALVAGSILLLWVAGLGFLARRELFRPSLDRLAEAGLGIDQYTSFYALRENDGLVGYASTVVDTTTTEITITDFMVRELSVRRRSSKRAKIRLSRTFKLKDFEWAINTPAVSIQTSGKVEGDSMIVTVRPSGKAPTTTTLKLDGPVLLPNLVPYAIALMDEPRVGKEYTLPVFDPVTQSIVQVKSRIQKETTFVIADSAVLDSATRMWKGIRDIKLKAWLVSSSAGGFNGWRDETGHIVSTTELDVAVMRSTIEQAFENWMVGVNQRRRQFGLLPPEPDSNTPRPPKPK